MFILLIIRCYKKEGTWFRDKVKAIKSGRSGILRQVGKSQFRCPRKVVRVKRKANVWCVCSSVVFGRATLVGYSEYCHHFENCWMLTKGLLCWGHIGVEPDWLPFFALWCMGNFSVFALYTIWSSCSTVEIVFLSRRLVAFPSSVLFWKPCSVNGFGAFHLVFSWFDA